MATHVIVSCDPDLHLATQIRTLFCRQFHIETPNPLTETNFNDLLQKIAQKAFDEGRRFQKEHGDL